MSRTPVAYLYEASPRQDFDLNPRRDPPLDFDDRPLGEMTPADYAELGFIAGLEVHQQLLTSRKLFCRCPSGRRVERVDARVLRHMRPTLSELGKYDACALMEFKTGKEIEYLIERESVCTYELDDTPPFEIDPEAVDIALEVSFAFDLNLVSELHVMRKQYLDGSIPTGFQRTALTGIGGRMPLRLPELGVDREIRIRQISLEEDSCREVSDVGHRITFRTDRLGTPLTETVTEPDLYTPFELQAGARLIALLTRASPRVRRGPGAARQDVNVSIAGGRRVELKGVGHHRRLPLLVHNEAFRQLNLLRIRAELERRGVTPDLLALPADRSPWDASALAIDAGSILRSSLLWPVADEPGRDSMLAAVRLPGFAGLLNHNTQPGFSFADEIRDRVRVIACFEGVNFLVESDGDQDAFEDSAWSELRAALAAESDDAIVVVRGPECDMETAVREIIARACEALDGVPSETRQTRLDGTTGFERLLPGPERMYPDTDTPPLPISDERVAAIVSRLPEPPFERLARWQRAGLARSAAERLLVRPWAALFDALAPRIPDTARRLAWGLEKRLTHLMRTGVVASLPPPERIAPLVAALDAGALRPEAFERVLDALLSEPRPAADLVAARTPRADDDAELDRLLTQVSDGVPRLKTQDREARLRFGMGIAMEPLLGRLDPERVRRRLGELFEAEAKAR